MKWYLEVLKKYAVFSGRAYERKQPLDLYVIVSN